MLVTFFLSLKKAGVPVSVREFLVLLEAMTCGLAFGSIDDFYRLSRTSLVKDEQYFDRFDRAFGAFFKELESFDDVLEALLPEDWLRSEFEKYLTDEEKDKIQSLGGLEKLIEEFKKRLEEQQKRHSGGSKWVGTGGTSPFGNAGYHPEGIRVGGEGRQGRAVTVWDKRQFRNLDASVELGTRNVKVALKRLRAFARTGAQEELDLDDTIQSTARNAGMLDIKMIPERHNAVKVLIFIDVGGSMYPYVQSCEELFSAARSEFKHLDYFYFHNFIYDVVWKDNRRRNSEVTATRDVLHKYARDYRVIFVGDASMAPYEVASPGGNIEYFNEEAGATWMQRVAGTYDRLAWLNPTPESYWEYTQSIHMIKELVDDRMFPLTLSGLDTAMRSLAS
ncbi:MAG TPA: VWA domain-containing protein [Gammaproteobacteria bacterium]|nr:VWA domain-containing protein [Gammaproteobacteria bacterium]